MGWDLIQCDWYSHKRTKFGPIKGHQGLSLRGKTVGGHREKVPAGKERGPRRYQTYQHISLEFLAFRTVGK